MIECDVLVVGGGPAGLSTSESASNSGLDVICIEKKENIGTPVQCAEGISRYLLDKLHFKFPKKLLEWNIDGLAFFVDEKEVFKKGKNWAGYSISRNIVEPWLASRAERSGAKIFTGTEFLNIKQKNKVYHASVKTKKENLMIKSKYVIGADGVISRVAQSLGIKEYPETNPGYVYSWEVKNIELEFPKYEYLFLGEFSPNGYGYIFPKSKNTANIGVGDLFGKKGIKRKFQKFLNDERVKSYLKKAKFVIEKSKEAPFLTRHLICSQNLYFVGDSANQNIKPFIEGFLPAVICGHALGEKLNELDPESYENLIDKILPELRESRYLIDPMISIFKRSDKKRFIELLELMLSLNEC
jgi:digeranylgeranylglycerophospholipid reductase